MRESTIQAQVIRWLKKNDYWYTKLHGSVFNTRGIPDLLILVPVAYQRYAVPVFIELKQPGNKPTALQEVMLRILRYKGVCAECCTSLEEVIAVIAAVNKS